VRIASARRTSAQALAAHAAALGARGTVVDDADAAVADCPLVVSTTPAQHVVLRALPRDDAFVCAVGAFTPRMVEWAPEVCRHVGTRGHIVVDTRDADHEAGDLLQAGLDVSAYPSLSDVVRAGSTQRRGPVFFKSCGWAGWDLAAARCVLGAANPATA
jgi:1-piperideine-2-carboxylate/1-pyrroline-2-carboxylate reductase [NAD(P)H]